MRLDCQKIPNPIEEFGIQMAYLRRQMDIYLQGRIAATLARKQPHNAHLFLHTAFLCAEVLWKDTSETLTAVQRDDSQLPVAKKQIPKPFWMSYE